MRIFDGTLRVETIKGKRGHFNVGTLVIDIGDFKVKDKVLDQFEPGSYSGHFTVEKIFTAATPWRGGFFTEQLAKIAEGGFAIDDEAAPSESRASAQVEPDPADSEGSAAISQPESTTSGSEPVLKPTLATQPAQPQTSPGSHASPSKVESAPGDVQTGAPSGQDDDRVLFGIELYPLFFERAAEIKLDPTVDRAQFRSQRDRLKAAGYRFDTGSQAWQLSQSKA